MQRSAEAAGTDEDGADRPGPEVPEGGEDKGDSPRRAGMQRSAEAAGTDEDRSRSAPDSRQKSRGWQEPVLQTDRNKSETGRNRSKQAAAVSSRAKAERKRGGTGENCRGEQKRDKNDGGPHRREPPSSRSRIGPQLKRIAPSDSTEITAHSTTPSTSGRAPTRRITSSDNPPPMRKSVAESPAWASRAMPSVRAAGSVQ